MDPNAAALDSRAHDVLARARLVALDVDGTLTDGTVTILSQGGEAQTFDITDGLALKWLQKEGITVAWITGRGSEGVERRAKELGIPELAMRVPDKRACLQALQERLRIAPEETVAMGDDLPDLGLFARAGFCAGPANSRVEVRERAHWISDERGGAGAVRALVELILRAQGRWRAIVDAASR